MAQAMRRDDPEPEESVGGASEEGEARRPAWRDDEMPGTEFPTIRVAHDGRATRYSAVHADFPGQEAVIVLTRAHDQLYLIDSSTATGALENSGVLAALFERVTADAREVDAELIPMTGAARAFYDSRPDCADVLRR